MREVAGSRFLKELCRRRVFRTAGLYVIGAWLFLQAANIVFPACSPARVARNQEMAGA
jgi:hypothetical protein